MKRIQNVTVMIAVLSLTGPLLAAGNGLVRFRGTVLADERHDVIPVCYGSHFVPVSVSELLEDPNGVFGGIVQVEVCYPAAQDLRKGDYVEVYGHYWGGICPKQYCSRVQIMEKDHYILPIGHCCPDGDWQVSDANMYSIPPGNVGIGTQTPQDKLHVNGNVLIESPGRAAYEPVLTVRHPGEGSRLAAYMTNPQDGNVQVELQLAGGRMLPWGWSLKAASGLFTLGSVMVVPPALNITSLGNVGLGVTNPAYRLELPNAASPAGRGRANSWTTYSSARWKTDIKAIADAMDRIRRLRGVSFRWKDGGRQDIGLVAEEVARVVPEVVEFDTEGGDASAVDYGRLVAVLIEALKEQDAQIAQLRQQIQQLRQAVENR